MELEKKVCECCGGSLKKKTNGSYECEFCGSRYTPASDGSAEKKEIVDSEILSYYKLAQKHYKDEEYNKGLEVLKLALELDENNPTTLLKLGRGYDNLGEGDKALDFYKKALEIDPEYGIAYNNIGIIYYDNQDWHNAAQMIEKALSLIDKNDDVYWTIYANYALVIAKFGNLKKAEAMIEVAEENGFDDGDEYRQRAGITEDDDSDFDEEDEEESDGVSKTEVIIKIVTVIVAIIGIIFYYFH
ncbi:MAG: tetratricopeptide repeat protein [Clostridia bacterium]|nr:tetratricopeptide repeat protein [Clostridia bacterium]